MINLSTCSTFLKADVALCRACLDLSTYQKPAGGCSQTAKIVWAGDRRAPSLKWMIKHPTTSCQAPFTPEGCFPWLPHKKQTWPSITRTGSTPSLQTIRRHAGWRSRGRWPVSSGAAGLSPGLRPRTTFGMSFFPGARPKRKAAIFAGPPFKDKFWDQKVAESLMNCLRKMCSELAGWSFGELLQVGGAS